MWGNVINTEFDKGDVQHKAHTQQYQQELHKILLILL